jgi:hypothetical protein
LFTLSTFGTAQAEHKSIMVKFVCVAAMVAMGIVEAASAGGPPDSSNKVCTARWIAHAADFGVLATISIHLNGAPFSNVASFADGTANNATGRPLAFAPHAHFPHHCPDGLCDLAGQRP